MNQKETFVECFTIFIMNFDSQVKSKKPNTFVLGSSCGPGGILTPNRWSRNPVRYTVAPRSHFGLWSN